MLPPLFHAVPSRSRDCLRNSRGTGWCKGHPHRVFASSHHPGSRPRAAAHDGTAELALDPDLRLPLLLPEYQPWLEAKCRGVSSLRPEQVCAFAMSLAGPEPPHLPSLGLSSFGKFSPTLVLSESTPIFPFYEFLLRRNLKFYCKTSCFYRFF